MKRVAEKMSNSSDVEESSNTVKKLQLPPNLRDLFAFSPDTIKSQDTKFEDGDILKNTLSRLKKQREEGKFCDVTFIAGADGTKIVAHRVILAGACDDFARIFSMRKKAELSMRNVRADVLEAIVNYCYTSSIVIRRNNVQALYTLAHGMQLHEIVENCSQFLVRHLHHSNCLQMKLFGEFMNDNGLMEAAKSYVEKNFVEVIKQEGFMCLSLDQLTSLLERNHLKLELEELELEEHRFTAVKRWVNHDSDSRRTHIPSLLQFLELNLLHPDFLVNTVEDFLPDEPAYKTMFMDLLKSHLFAKRRGLAPQQLHSSESSELRRVFLVGPNMSDSDNSFIECYHPKTNTWSRSHKIYDKRENFEVAVLDENLYVIGGRIDSCSSKTVMCLNLRTGVWSPSVSMNSERHSFGVAVLDGFIYAIGGRDDNYYLKTAERWQPSSNEWEYVSQLENSKYESVVTVFGGMLFTVGSDSDSETDSDNSEGETIECYNPSTNKWTQRSSLATGRKSVGMVASSKYLYVIRKEIADPDSSAQPFCIERYHPETDAWTFAVRLTNAPDSIATCLFGKRIFITSCYAGNRINDVEEYDMTTNKVTYLTSLRSQKHNLV